MTGLAALGWVREERPDNSARPPAAWIVNPKVHSLFATRAEQERKRRAQAREEVAENLRRHRHEG